MIEVDSGGAAPEHPGFPGGYRTSSATVDADYFDVLGAPLRAGRAFHAGDLAPDSRVVIVNASFVRLVLGGRNPIGRHVRYRYAALGPRSGDWEPGPWHEIVGVVPDLGMSKARDPKVAAFYHPLAADVDVPLHVAVHVRGDPVAFAPRLRAVAAAVDPTLRVDAVARMDTLSDPGVEFTMFWVACACSAASCRRGARSRSSQPRRCGRTARRIQALLDGGDGLRCARARRSRPRIAEGPVATGVVRGTDPVRVAAACRAGPPRPPAPPGTGSG